MYPHCVNKGLSENGCSSVSLASASSAPYYLVPPNSYIQKYVIPECIEIPSV